MKAKYIFLGLAAATTVLTGCNESSFLDNPPQGVVSESTLATEQGAEELCTAAYGALMGPNPQDWSVWWYPVTHWTTGSVRADDALKGGGGQGDGAETHRLETFTLDATDGVTDSKWYHLYVSIQRCNSALKVLNNLEGDHDTRIAEMKVLRAHYFFELQRLFNQIPYFDENTEDVASIPNNQYTREELLDEIANEINVAISDLPETQTEVGRVNKWMAKAYLAKVYLYRAYEQDATSHKVTNINKDYLERVVSLCDEIKGSLRYCLFDDFQDLDLVKNDNGSECIWDIQFSMNDGTNSAGRINWSMLLNAPQGPYSGDGFFLPSQDLINAYQVDEKGLPEFNYQSLPDFDKVTVEGEGDAAVTTTSNNDHAVDPRLDFIIGRPGVTWKTYTPYNTSDEDKATPCLGTWVRDRGTYGYHCSKRFFVSPESSDMYQGWPWGASALNWHMIRYAHILLWKAEALVELGRQEEAIPIINEIRVRAMNSAYVKSWKQVITEYVKDNYASQTEEFQKGKIQSMLSAYHGNVADYDGYAANYKIGLYPKTLTQEEARQAVRTESRLETAMEGERFFDLVRWGIAGDVMTKYLAKENASGRVYYGGATFTSGKDEYLPITNNQYKFSSKNYVQNPGYASFN